MFVETFAPDLVEVEKKPRRPHVPTATEQAAQVLLDCADMFTDTNRWMQGGMYNNNSLHPAYCLVGGVDHKIALLRKERHIDGYQRLQIRGIALTALATAINRRHNGVSSDHIVISFNDRYGRKQPTIVRKLREAAASLTA